MPQALTRSLLLLILAIQPVLHTNTHAEEAPHPMPEMLGEWRLISMQMEGQGEGPETAGPLTVFTANTLEIQYESGFSERGTYTLDTSVKPARITLLRDGDSEEADRLSYGLIKIEAGRLHLVLNDEGETAWPTRFASEPGDSPNMGYIIMARPNDAAAATAPATQPMP
ncbi:MAG: TIGR03067 domain-containing protein [Planctomycetota bacterium]